MRMNWKKLGIVYSPNQEQGWAYSHAMVPTPYLISNDVIRVFITCCDIDGIGRPGYVDVSAYDPKKVIGFSKNFILDIGKPGTFDENGVLCCSVIQASANTMFMYYVGFELGHQIRYRLLTGLAISEDGGHSFKRYKQTPILERSPTELYFRGGPCCIRDEGLYKMWYVAGSTWENIGEKTMPVYEVKYIESRDGIHWPDSGKTVLPITEPDEHGFGRPFVLNRNCENQFQLFYSVRRRSLLNYRLGYALSDDGLQWMRKDSYLNLDVSESGFDSDGIMYAAPIQVHGKLYVFYNGNNFGESGFAVAMLESS
jgi:hypothetical protein